MIDWYRLFSRFTNRKAIRRRRRKAKRLGKKHKRNATSIYSNGLCISCRYYNRISRICEHDHHPVADASHEPLCPRKDD